MQNFFNHSVVIDYGLIVNPQWDYVRAGLQKNLKTIKDYYKSRVYTVKSNHFISKLLLNLNVPFSLELERFHDVVDNKSHALSMAMKMTSSVYRGFIFEGMFYGNMNQEIIVTDNSYFSPFDAIKNWKNLQPVKVVKHHISELEMMLPNGRQTSDAIGVNVISVNIPMLAIQYRGFAKEQMRKKDSTLGLGHFIHMYVLPNMLDSHLDMCIMNRFKNLLEGSSMSTSNRKHSFTVIDYSRLVDEVLIDIIKRLAVKNQEYYNTLENIPAVVQNNMLDVLRLPENAQTKQYKWIEVLARIDEINVLARIDSLYPGSMNRGFNNEFLRYFKLLENSQVLESYLPAGMLMDTQYDINRFKETVAKK